MSRLFLSALLDEALNSDHADSLLSHHYRTVFPPATLIRPHGFQRSQHLVSLTRASGISMPLLGEQRQSQHSTVAKGAMTKSLANPGADDRPSVKENGQTREASDGSLAAPGGARNGSDTPLSTAPSSPHMSVSPTILPPPS
jgi:hypothetical protein